MAFVIRKGTLSDIEAFVALLREIRQGMDNPEWFYLDTPEDVRQWMSDGSMELWLAMDGSRIAAAFNVIFPGLNSTNYGYDIGLEETQLMQVVHMDTAAVHPDYRGRGLQRLLMQTAEQEVTKHGPRILLCTVHPDNRFSLNNILHLGYSIAHTLPKYGSVRCVLRKDVL